MGRVRSLINYFWVDKGGTDIRVVYDGTGCGLNAFIWAMHFGLPTMRHTLRSLLPGYYQCDADIGEMFLNFMLHEMLRELSGVDISHVRSGDPVFEEARATAWERWCRNWMGLKDSPVRSIQLMTRVKLVAYGDRRVRTNPFHYARVVFNLPGTPGYRPDLPWVMKVRFDGHLACEVFVYVDDSRATGHCRWIAWKAIRRFPSVCTLHGIQIAERKSTFSSVEPASWAGTNTETSGGQVAATVSQKKWEKTKACVRQLAELVSAADEAAPPGSSEAVRIPLKPLLSIMGFLIYVVRTYDWMTPYLKGLNNVINGWRPGYEDGWKLTGVAARQFELVQERLRGQQAMMFRRAHEDDLDELVDVPAEPEAPATVEVFDRLRRDIRALLELTDAEDPPKRRVRSKEVLVALYLPGDASGKGFGSALIRREGVEYEAGAWKCEWHDRSSNFREADNLVRRIEDLVKGGLSDAEIFIYTDNFVFESCYYKGYSKTSPELSDVILRLYKAAREGGLTLHVIWIAGTRMKEIGVDGLSRGDMLDGIMAGMDPVNLVPISQGADQRSAGAVTRWIRGWWKQAQTPGCAETFGQAPLVEVTKDNMFELRNVVGSRLWVLPPAVMETALEMFTEDRVAHPWNAHVFAVPQLMTHLWRHSLGKDADLSFTVQTGNHFWARTQHEALLIAVVLPLCHSPTHRGPWVLRGSETTVNLARELERGFRLSAGKLSREQLSDMDPAVQEMWKSPERRSRTLLLQFLDSARKFPPVQECLVRRLLRGEHGGPVPAAPGGGARLGGSGGRGKRPAPRQEGPHEVQKRKKR